jgi:RNA polymerase sigma factor (sigma-70 family)
MGKTKHEVVFFCISSIEERHTMTERQLLQRFVTANDHDAFKLLIDRHGPMVLGVCRSVLREQHDVEDAFQNTFVALARRAGTIKNRENIGPWLHRVALRVARSARFKARQTRAREQNCSEPATERKAEPRDLSFIPLLREEVSRLPEHHRLPVELCYLDGKTNEEAAAHLCCPVGTIKGRLWRARQTLRARLSRRFVDFVPGVVRRETC